MASPAELNRKFRQAELERDTQLKLILILKPLSQESRIRVMSAARHLIDADGSVDGILDAYLGWYYRKASLFTLRWEGSE